jgi:hypothetical protein
MLEDGVVVLGLQAPVLKTLAHFLFPYQIINIELLSPNGKDIFIKGGELAASDAVGLGRD